MIYIFFYVFCIEQNLFAYTWNIIKVTNLPPAEKDARLEGYMFRFFQSEKTKDNYYTLLMNDLQKTAQDLRNAYCNLGNAVDPDLIDCYIYELNAVQMRYKFLLASIKDYENMHPLGTHKKRGLLHEESS